MSGDLLVSGIPYQRFPDVVRGVTYGAQIEIRRKVIIPYISSAQESYRGRASFKITVPSELQPPN